MMERWQFDELLDDLEYDHRAQTLSYAPEVQFCGECTDSAAARDRYWHPWPCKVATLIGFIRKWQDEERARILDRDRLVADVLAGPQDHG